MSRLNFQETLIPRLTRGRGIPDSFNPVGKFKYQLLDALGKPLTDELIAPNGITTIAKNDIFNVYFNAGTQPTAANWSLGLIDNSTFTAISNSDLISSHTGWTEFTGYKRSDDNTTNRATWGQGSASSAQITNASQVTFTFTASGSVTGIFVASSTAKSATTGILWSTALFAAPLAVAIDDILRVTYTLSA